MLMIDAYAILEFVYVHGFVALRNSSDLTHYLSERLIVLLVLSDFKGFYQRIILRFKD